MLCTSLTLTVLYTSTITYNAYLCTSLTLTVLYTSTITYNAYLCRPLALTILYTSTVWLCTNIPVYIYVLPNSGCVLLCLNANIFVHKHQFLIYIYIDFWALLISPVDKWSDQADVLFMWPHITYPSAHLGHVTYPIPFLRGGQSHQRMLVGQIKILGQIRPHRI